MTRPNSICLNIILSSILKLCTNLSILQPDGLGSCYESNFRSFSMACFLILQTA